MTNKKYNIAIAGATGNVGRVLLDILDERKFPIANLYPLASSRSAGKEVQFGDEKLKVLDIATFDYGSVDIVLASGGSAVSELYLPKFAEAGAYCVDNASYYRMDEDKALVVPEVNPNALDNLQSKIIANPNCSTIQMVMALKPIHEKFGIKRVVTSTYQSVSGAGKEAMDELYDQTKAYYQGADRIENSKFTKRIAFNCIPHIDVFKEDGNTKEEWKMIVETKKILEADIPVSATCVRLPSFVGHGLSLNLELEKPFEEDDIFECLDNFEGVHVMDRREDGGYMTPAEVTGEDAVYVSRIRKDASIENGLNLWCVADNIRKGAALNTIQIAEELIIKGII